MADIPSANSLPDFGKKYGPLPLGAWVILAGAGIGFYMLRSRGSDTVIDPADLPEDGSVPAGVGEGPGWTYVGPPTDDPPRSDTLRSNVAWASLAIERTIANTNYSAPGIIQAITLYVNKQGLTDRQIEIVGRAVELIGPPPKPLQIRHKQHKPHGNAGGGNQPKPPARPTPGDTKWYRIKRGDSLLEIAQKFYANPSQRTADIFNANRQGADRPGPSDGFMNNPGDLPAGKWLFIPGPTK